jgi:hypothetical protein
MKSPLFCAVVAFPALALFACGEATPPVHSASGPTTPSRELYPALRQFLAADTLPQHPKFYAAYLQQGPLAGDLTVYLFDEYNANGEVKHRPLTTWEVDQKTIFVFTGLEALAAGGDTLQHPVIRATEAANRGKVWSPPRRCWRIQVNDRQVGSIEPAFFNPFGPRGTPPPFPRLRSSKNE